MINTTEILSQLINATVIVSLLGYLGKQFFEILINNKFEKFKHELETEKERFKNSLTLMSKEHEVKFTKLHEKRFEQIATLYPILFNFEQRWNIYLNNRDAINPNVIELNKSFIHEMLKYIIELETLFGNNKLYFTPTFSSQVEEFLVIAKSLVTKAMNPEWKEEINFDLVTDKLKVVKNQIEFEFREYLGVK